MILKGIILFASIIWLAMGLVTCLTPGVNNIFLPVEVTSQEQAILIRSISGIFIALGYLSIRFVFSSSKVQIGNVLLTIVLCAIFSKLCSFIYDGITIHSLLVFSLLAVYSLGLYYLQKKRKNQLDYNL
ncbi:hypothetical protein OAD75_01470 [Gammaproteobacteria bacterium]|nr:hypothetical protein [Gammaproteobacteria bacterium]